MQCMCLGACADYGHLAAEMTHSTADTLYWLRQCRQLRDSTQATLPATGRYLRVLHQGTRPGAVIQCM